MMTVLNPLQCERTKILIACNLLGDGHPRYKAARSIQTSNVWYPRTQRKCFQHPNLIFFFFFFLYLKESAIHYFRYSGLCHISSEILRLYTCISLQFFSVWFHSLHILISVKLKATATSFTLSQTNSKLTTRMKDQRKVWMMLCEKWE